MHLHLSGLEAGCQCGLPSPNHSFCGTCGRRACRGYYLGIYLARLYPLEVFCWGCGRRSVHCTCERV